MDVLQLCESPLRFPIQDYTSKKQTLRLSSIEINSTGCSHASTAYSTSITYDFPDPSTQPRQSFSEEEITSEYIQKAYDNIEAFFDQEGLHIIGPCTSNSAKTTTLKVCPDFEKIKCFKGNSVGTTDTSECLQGKDIKNVAMPSFLLKRAMSSTVNDKAGKGSVQGLAGRRAANSTMNIQVERPKATLIIQPLNQENEKEAAI